MDVWCGLYLQLSTQAVEDIFGFDLFSGVVIDEIETIPQLGIIPSTLKVGMSEAKPVTSLAIVLV